MKTIDLGTIEEDPMIDLWDRKFPQSTVKAWKDIIIERELGSGQFGKVYKGFLNSNYTRYARDFIIRPGRLRPLGFEIEIVLVV